MRAPSICLNPGFEDAWSVGLCGHTFCEACIFQRLAANGGICPTCSSGGHRDRRRDRTKSLRAQARARRAAGGGGRVSLDAYGGGDMSTSAHACVYINRR